MGCNLCDDCSECTCGYDIECGAWSEYHSASERRSRFDDFCDWISECDDEETFYDEDDDEGIFNDDDGIDCYHAADYVNHVVTVHGVVAFTFHDKKKEFLHRFYPEAGVERPPVFIDLGARYPASGGLSLVVWGRNRRNFPASLESDLLGERICVTGEVYLYKGEAYMELTSPSQIALC